MMNYAINEKLNGVEIRFSSKPGEDIRTTLKNNGFRWSHKKGIWYAKNTPERVELVKSMGATKGETAPAKKQEANKYGVNVGDIFYTSWGYEQTQTDFFQVVALVGSASVRVREVAPPVSKDKATSAMSAARTYKITGEILPAVERSVFIEDQEHGDLKRLKSFAADGVSHPLFKLSSFADAHKVETEEITLYESWYY